MKPFGYHTIYAIDVLRRFRYRAGHGVHSPLAFTLVGSVSSCSIPFYAFDEIAESLPEDTPEREVRVGQFLFRLLAHAPKGEVFYLTDNASTGMPLWGKRAAPDSIHTEVKRPEEIAPTASPLLVYAPIPSLAADLLETNEGLLRRREASIHRPMLLIDGIRRNKEEYRIWRECLRKRISHCIVLDLYHCALVIGGHRAETQLFRGYLNLT
ncbi:hypothetical protein HQ29_01815 [Porphyromonas canoris]|uniref:hypothetical protein n=1 Tax=Porphyromonas canoris TaxID=36875 RepID=UPI00051D3ACC|nr:hypothetical protein [Porphyromonas canoris]KGL53336.1 hypothetical protein HQ29_01815 [Porphyromonas canoris]